jgi:hypothetical protein
LADPEARIATADFAKAHEMTQTPVADTSHEIGYA